jgi:hypothetical protein
MNYVRPVKMVSPTGQMSTPKIVEKQVGQQIHVEAHWYDPASGAFFHRGLVEIKQVEQPKK